MVDSGASQQFGCRYRAPRAPVGAARAATLVEAAAAISRFELTRRARASSVRRDGFWTSSPRSSRRGGGSLFPGPGVVSEVRSEDAGREEPFAPDGPGPSAQALEPGRPSAALVVALSPVVSRPGVTVQPGSHSRIRRDSLEGPCPWARTRPKPRYRPYPSEAPPWAANCVCEWGPASRIGLGGSP